MVPFGKVKKKSLCLGCGLCASVSGLNEMPLTHDDAGFFVPEVDEHTDVSQYCPAVKVQAQYEARNAEEEVWGPMEGVSIGHAVDDEVRFKGSSGGGLSAFLIFLLEQRHIKGVIQVRADQANPLMNASVLSTTREEIVDCAGSRYAPAATLFNIVDILNKIDGPLAFVGKPCDVAGVRNLLVLFPEFRRKLIVFVSFFCAGMPSISGTKSILRDLQLSENVTYLRYRGHGWPGMFEARDEQGRKGVMSYADSWGKTLGKRIHPRCKVCPDAVGILSDITFADGWEEQDGYPSFEEKPGESLIIARSGKARQLLEEAVEKQYLRTEAYHGNLDRIQQYQYRRRMTIGARQLAANALSFGILSFTGLYIFRNARKTPLFDLARAFAGTLKRFLRR